jgi:hypothetical protein
VLDILPSLSWVHSPKKTVRPSSTRKDNVLQSTDLPNLDEQSFETPDLTRLLPAQRATHAPRILLLYGSARERSYSRLLTEEAARLLRKLGAEPRILIHVGCRCQTMRRRATPRSRSCASWCNGPKAWCGLHPSAMAQ